MSTSDAEPARLSFWAALYIGINMGLSTPQLVDPKVTVSHYTDAAGLLGVVSSNELWLTDALFMNDSSELSETDKYFANLSDVVTAFFDDAGWPKRWDRVGREKPIGCILSGFEAAYRDEAVTDDPGIYAMCFCESGDLLSQWRGYGHFGGGYSIQLQSSRLRQMALEVPKLSFEKVLYDEAECRRAAKAIITMALGTYNTMATDALDDGDALHMVGEAIGNAARELSVKIKNRSFREEQEWRLIYRASESTVPQSTALKRKYRPSKRGITPYVRIRTDAEPPRYDASAGAALYDSGPARFAGLPIVSVTTGPTADHGSAARSIGYLLKDCGLPDVYVERSSIPFRD
jgi:Protein of unknown function (DUF2971)